MNRRTLTLLITLILLSTYVTIPMEIPLEARLAKTNFPTLNWEDTPLSNFQQPKEQEKKNSLNDGSWIEFFPGADDGAPAEVTLLSSDTSRLTVLLECPGMWKRDVILNSERYDHLEVVSAGHISELGEPQLPMITKMLEVPHDIDISVISLNVEYQDLTGYNVAPMQEFVYPTRAYGNPGFVINELRYGRNDLYPERVAYIEGGMRTNPIVIRGHRVVILHLLPVQFNPVAQTCRVYSKIKVAVNYARPATIQPISSRLHSPAYEELLQGYLLNYPQGLYNGITDFWGNKSKISWSYKQLPTDGCEYLIISADEFVDSLRALVHWKTQKGVPTKLISITEVFNELGRSVGFGQTEVRNAITDYVKLAYEWDPVPTYVLLVGDVDTIPTHYPRKHSKFSYYLVPTDSRYFLLDGPDFIPEMLYGRISVDSASQTTIIVDKILSYEKTGVSFDPFYRTICASAYFQDKDNNGQEDPLFRLVRATENLYEFLDTRWQDYYDVRCVYTAGRTHLDVGWAQPEEFEDGTPLDPRLNNHDWYDHLEQRDRVVEAINDGAFLVFNIGHGESRNAINPENSSIGQYDGWTYPQFTTYNFSSLNNLGRFPFVLSLDCNSGWFDETTDAQFNNYWESFSEELLRLNNMGAVATLGAARPVQSAASSSLLEGIMDAIWCDYDGNQWTGGLTSVGQIIDYGKMHVMDQWGYLGSDICTLNTFELYQLFGDPEMPLWTQEPEELEAYYPTHIGSGGIQRFVVQAKVGSSRVSSARVCLQKGNEVYAVNYTDSRGYAYFAIEPTTSGPMNLTITAKNYLPCHKTILVTSEGPVVQLSANSGPEGTTITIKGSGFTSELIFLETGNPWTIVTTDYAENGEIEFTYQIPIGYSGEPLNFWVYEVWYTPWGLPVVFHAGIAYFTRIYEAPDLYTYCQWNEETWGLNPDGSSTDENPRWDNPAIQIRDDQGHPVYSGNLILGSFYTIHADIHNSGPVTAEGVQVFFNWSTWGIGQVVWSILGNDTIDVVAGGQATAIVVFQPTIVGALSIKVIAEHPNDGYTTNNWGLENTFVFSTLSSGEVLFPLLNPTSIQSLLYLNVKQIETTETIWHSTLDHPAEVELSKGESMDIILEFKIPEDAAEGETRNFTITAYVGSVLGDIVAGGLEVCVKKTTPEPPPIPFLVILAALIIVAVILICIYLVIRKRNRDTKN